MGQGWRRFLLCADGAWWLVPEEGRVEGGGRMPAWPATRTEPSRVVSPPKGFLASDSLAGDGALGHRAMAIVSGVWGARLFEHFRIDTSLWRLTLKHTDDIVGRDFAHRQPCLYRG